MHPKQRSCRRKKPGLELLSSAQVSVIKKVLSIVLVSFLPATPREWTNLSTRKCLGGDSWSTKNQERSGRLFCPVMFHWCWLMHWLLVDQWSSKPISQLSHHPAGRWPPWLRSHQRLHPQSTPWQKRFRHRAAMKIALGQGRPLGR